MTHSNAQRIHVIGLGAAEVAPLSSAAQQALRKAQLVIGSVRQLKTLQHVLNDMPDIETCVLPKLSELKQLLEARGSKNMVVLASGDPLFFGVGHWLGRHFLQSELVFHPAVSSVQSVCHALGLSLQYVDVVSLHGRPLASLKTRLQDNKTLVVLSDKQSQPQHLAALCQQLGYAQSTLWVCEKMGYADENIRQFSVEKLLSQPDDLTFDALHISVIKLAGSGNFLPQFPGIPDENFITGKVHGAGMISKREVRLVILSSLQAVKGDVVWDVGAGCGSVAIELAFWNQQTHVYAIENHQQRLTYLNANREAFGVVQNVHIVDNTAPACFADLPQPNKIFIGGSNGDLPNILQACWQVLGINGVLVASAVTDKNKIILREFMQYAGAGSSMSEVSVSRSMWDGDMFNNDNKKPVAVYKFIKQGAVNER